MTEDDKIIIDIAQLTIARLRKERDEARREVCRLLDKDSEFRVSNETTAKRKGWDCYASDTLSQEVSQDVSLRKGLKQAKEGKFSKNPPKIKQKKKK